MGALMLAGIAPISAAVVSRYVFGKAIFWAEEVLVFANIWGRAARAGGHHLARRASQHGPVLRAFPACRAGRSMAPPSSSWC